MTLLRYALWLVQVPYWLCVALWLWMQGKLKD